MNSSEALPSRKASVHVWGPQLPLPFSPSPSPLPKHLAQDFPRVWQQVTSSGVAIALWRHPCVRGSLGQSHPATDTAVKSAQGSWAVSG